MGKPPALPGDWSLDIYVCSQNKYLTYIYIICYYGASNTKTSFGGTKMEKEEIREIILDSMVVSLEAQLRALKRLRGSREEDEPREKSKSQIDIVFNILSTAGAPLHVSKIISEAEKVFGVKLERESVVSALSKKIVKGERFLRTGKNTFALKAR